MESVGAAVVPIAAFSNYAVGSCIEQGNHRPTQAVEESPDGVLPKTPGAVDPWRYGEKTVIPATGDHRLRAPGR